MDWHGLNTSSFSSQIDDLGFDFEPKIYTVFQSYKYTVRLEALGCVSALIISQNSEQIQQEVQKLPDHRLGAWLRKVRRECASGRQRLMIYQAPDDSTNRVSVRGMRIV